MGWRFRRRITVFPGVRINVSRRGLSTTFGMPGASINVGASGAYFNAGIPGTGIYNRTKLFSGSAEPQKGPTPVSFPEPSTPIVFVPQAIGAIQSNDNDTITSIGLRSVREALLAAYRERDILTKEFKDGQRASRSTERVLNLIQMIPFHRQLLARTLAARKEEYNATRASLEEAENQLRRCKVQIGVRFDSASESEYLNLCNAFATLQTSHFCGDITREVGVDKVKTRSRASASVDRRPISLEESRLDFVDSDYPALHFVNANGCDLYLYPTFLIAFQSITDFALVDLKDLNIEYSTISFVEEEAIPKDTQVVGSTWKYVNKDGSRDLRFSKNYNIPLVQYGELHFRTTQGLNEAYQFSNAWVTRSFFDAFSKFKTNLDSLPRLEKQEQKSSAYTNCTQCGEPNPSEYKFCGRCGIPLFIPSPSQHEKRTDTEILCSQCGKANPPEFNFCGSCGAPLFKPSMDIF